MHFDKILSGDEKTNKHPSDSSNLIKTIRSEKQISEELSDQTRLISKSIIVLCEGREGEEGFDFLHACNYLPLYLK